MAVGFVEGREILVVYTQRTPARRRLISVRRAILKERRLYAQAFPPDPAK